MKRSYTASAREQETRAQEAERRIRERWWLEKHLYCACPKETPTRRYFRDWVCVCNGTIRK